MDRWMFKAVKLCPLNKTMSMENIGKPTKKKVNFQVILTKAPFENALQCAHTDLESGTRTSLSKKWTGVL